MPIITKTGMKWRMESPCDNCPFSESEAGRFLRETLRAQRVAGIEKDLLKGRHFVCHKTTEASGKRKKDNMICAGAIAWQAKHGIVADIVQVMERLEAAGLV